MKRSSQNCFWSLGGCFLGTACTILLLVPAFAVWILRHFSADAVAAAMKQPAGSDALLQEWMKTGFGWPGIRYLSLQILTHSFSGLLVILCLLLSAAGLWKIRRTAGKLKTESRDLLRLLSEPLQSSDSQSDPEDRQKSADHKQRFWLRHIRLQPFGNDRIQRRRISETDRIRQAVLKSREDVYRMIELRNQAMQLDRDQYENVLHQVRSRLMSLWFCLDELPNADSQTAATMESVLNECDRLLRNGLEKSVYARCRLDAIIQSCLQEKTAQIAQKQLKIETDIPVLQLVGDSLWLCQIFEVLLANALDEAPAFSTLSIQARQTGKEIQVSVKNAAADQPEQMKKREQLFERYHSKRSGHFGIGLHLAGEIAGRHQGRIEVSPPEIVLGSDGEPSLAVFCFRLIVPCSILETASQ